MSLPPEWMLAIVVQGPALANGMPLLRFAEPTWRSVIERPVIGVLSDRGLRCERPGKGWSCIFAQVCQYSRLAAAKVGVEPFVDARDPQPITWQHGDTAGVIDELPGSHLQICSEPAPVHALDRRFGQP